jgi:hypothetical protein
MTGICPFNKELDNSKFENLTEQFSILDYYKDKNNGGFNNDIIPNDKINIIE